MQEVVVAIKDEDDLRCGVEVGVCCAVGENERLSAAGNGLLPF